MSRSSVVYSNKSDLTICPKMEACGEKKPLGACLIDPCILDPCVPEPSVIIIGAGLAGLSAAHRLTKCGIRNFTVLEATERPGGRIHSCWLNDSGVEMGSQWIHGTCAANPVFSLAAQEGLLRPPLSRSDDTAGYFYTTDGRAHVSLAEFLASQIDQELSRFPDFDREDASRVMHGLANSLRARQGDDLSLVSADHYGSYVVIPGGNVRVPLGHVGILAPLLRDLPECCVKYCTPVKCIMWDAEETAGPRARVQCFNGEEYACDYVIVTASLGVLKNTAKQLFCPELPD
uniref:Amine oxidase domain-containing protein n=1 Tax=Timema poppense TaxID=170557 RepID=A0A7R9CMP5_TIMPO|nr:unnamed protein product [Timema poppensis]